jgi:hypothetical protein
MINKITGFIKHLNNVYGVSYFSERKKYKLNVCSTKACHPNSLTLKNDGIVQLPPLPPTLVKLLSGIDSLKREELILKRESNCAAGISERVIISLKNNELQKYVDEFVTPCILGYFNKSYVMRGNPRVIFNKPTDRQPADRFHIDYGFHQVTLQVLLTNVSDEDTHMEYIVGSNQSSWFSPRASLFTSKKPNTFKKDYNRVKLIGAPGTSFLFDAGNGYHRANTSSKKSSCRKVLSINFSANTHIHLPSDLYEEYSLFESVITEETSLYKPFKSKGY